MKRELVIAATLVAVVAVASPARAGACEDAERSVRITLSKRASLRDVAAVGVEAGCKVIQFGPDVVGRRINIVAPDTLRAADAYELFLRALAMMDLAVVPKGNALRIVDTRTRKDTPRKAVFIRPQPIAIRTLEFPARVSP